MAFERRMRKGVIEGTRPQRQVESPSAALYGRIWPRSGFPSDRLQETRSRPSEGYVGMATPASVAAATMPGWIAWHP